RLPHGRSRSGHPHPHRGRPQRSPAPDRRRPRTAPMAGRPDSAWPPGPGPRPARPPPGRRRAHPTTHRPPRPVHGTGPDHPDRNTVTRLTADDAVRILTARYPDLPAQAGTGALHTLAVLAVARVAADLSRRPAE